MQKPEQAANRERLLGYLDSYGDEEFDLREFMLLLSGAFSANLTIEACRDELSDLEDEALLRINPDLDPSAVAEELCHFVRDYCGFRGSLKNSRKPASSYLARMLETRRGIPITLAAIYIFIGRALGAEVHGVSFPRYFLVRVGAGSQARIIDPIRGEVLSPGECRELLRKSEGKVDSRVWIREISDRQIAARILVNLKMAHMDRKEFESSLWCCHCRLALLPDSVDDLVDRALLYERIGQHEAARNDLEILLGLEEEPSRRIKALVDRLGSGEEEPFYLH